MYHLKQFVIYRPEWNSTRGKFDKIPIDPHTGYAGSPINPQNWLTYDEAKARGGENIGFVLTEADPYFCLDIDGAIVEGQWSQLARDLCNTFAGAFIERSMSGAGLHIWGRAAPGQKFPQHRCRNSALNVELYHADRFIALGRDNNGQSLDTDCSAALNDVIGKYFAAVDLTGLGNDGEWSAGPSELWSGPADDDELLKTAFSRKPSGAAAFGNKATFEQLWKGEGAQFYGGDESAADAALIAHLGYWTGYDCDRMARMLARDDCGAYREKWSRPDGVFGTYLRRSISAIYKKGGNVFQGKPHTQATTVAEPVGRAATAMIEGDTILFPDQQLEWFDGCVYVASRKKIVDKTGNMMDSSQFDVMYGGRTFQYKRSEGGRQTTESAFEAFTKSQVVAFPKVRGCRFLPHEAPGKIIQTASGLEVNSYYPVITERKAGDASPFLEFMRKLLPDDGDRNQYLAYMAACIQHKGKKFQWWPVLQGAEGNGKTLISSVMQFALGEKFCHLPNPAQIAKHGMQFNSWVEGKLFLGIEEISVGKKREVLEEIKTLVTNARIPIEGKGIDQVTGDNYANGMMFTNYKNAIPVTVDSRRYAIFYCAQQSKADIMRDGMGGSYFPALYDWLFNGGYAIVNEWLHTLAIPDEINPAKLMQRAPSTTATNEAIAHSFGALEEEIAEAIAQGLPGFAGGWVSSIMLGRLFESKGIRVSPRARHEALRAIGYEHHPGLPDGRTDNAIAAPDCGKPRLYIRPGHLATNLPNRAAIAAAYCNAQTTKAAFTFGGAAA